MLHFDSPERKRLGIECGHVQSKTVVGIYLVTLFFLPLRVSCQPQSAKRGLVGSILLVILLFPVVCFGQLPSSGCDSNKSTLEECALLTYVEPSGMQAAPFKWSLPHRDAAWVATPEEIPDNEPDSGHAAIATVPLQREGFHWRRALTESFTFLLIEQAYVVHTDFNWVVSENGVPFNHFWRDYKQSLSQWTHSGWNDGDPNWFGYVGHPVQGALTSFIQIQNDPQGEKLEFSRTKAYWWSRLKATLWNAAYSTQWNLGPLSEVTLEKYGTKDRAPWTYAGTFPCSRHCLTGVGQIDLVMTPLGGAGWLIGEDFLDKFVARRIERATQNRFVIDTARCGLNPLRGGANILHGKQPWYRASRDADRMNLLSPEKAAVSQSEIPNAGVPNHGDVFFGYSHMGASRCQAVFSSAPIACDPTSAKSSNLTGWSFSVEKNYLRYFGAVAEFSGQYGNVPQRNFLFGLRGQGSIGRLGPFVQVLVGAVHAQGNRPAGLNSDTTFAEDLGMGVNFRLTRLLSWRSQADEVKTGASEFKRRNLRLASGLAVRF
jgi:hypothetical protein